MAIAAASVRGDGSADGSADSGTNGGAHSQSIRYAHRRTDRLADVCAVVTADGFAHLRSNEDTDEWPHYGTDGRTNHTLL